MSGEVKDNWYEDFFQGINCELWLKAIPPEFTRQELEFLLTELRLEKGESILDMPCGYGRHAIELAKMGFNVTGVDISETFITVLKTTADAEQLSLQAIQADILALQLTAKYSAALCLGNSFGYFDYNKMKIFVEKVAGSLNSCGRFIINSGMIAECILPNFLNYARNKTYQVEDITMEVTNDYKAETGCMISNLLYTKEGKQEEHSFKHFVFTLAEVKRLLEQYGLRTVACYGSITKEIFKLGDQQVYIVAQKQ